MQVQVQGQVAVAVLRKGILDWLVELNDQPEAPLHVRRQLTVAACIIRMHLYVGDSLGSSPKLKIKMQVYQAWK